VIPLSRWNTNVSTEVQRKRTESLDYCDLLRGYGDLRGFIRLELSGMQCIFEVVVDGIIVFLFTLGQREQVEVEGFFVP